MGVPPAAILNLFLSVAAAAFARPVAICITNMFHKDNKTELFTPGFIYVLHTFGRDLKWNSHIHCLVSEVVWVNPAFGEINPILTIHICTMLFALPFLNSC